MEDFLRQKTKEIEDYFEKWLLGMDDVPSSLVDSMRYSVLGGGKRFRPMLCLATVNLLKGDEDVAIPFACAIELIHTYSLIHDDLPCMDDDEYRRGKLTSHKMFGEAHAILTGDGLITEAFGMMACAGSMIDPKVALKIMQEGARFAGVRGMVGGQVMDMEEVSPAPEMIQKIHLHKTADLMMYAVRVGGHLCHAREEILDSLTQFSRYVGLAFQLQDDILDVTESDETYPSLVGLEKSKEEVKGFTKKASDAIRKLHEGDSCLLREIAEFVLTRNC